MNQKEINVHIGEVKIAKNGEILKAILGSCVAIGILWEKRGVCGLAHCLLAENPEKTFAIGGRFVDQAIPSLLALMKIRLENFGEIEVILPIPRLGTAS
ncbi:MAG: chemotaxis protein CheD [Bdellovibrionales bacterium]|nr:chemotaxis protein CheD [Bdellovibrionales bacterium]